jgi:riboflavin synthase
MFSGIVETQSRIRSAKRDRGLVIVEVERPESFDDLKIGDSIATSGVCLTVEAFTPETIRFALGQETLNVTGWTETELQGAPVNLERSLRMGDRIHGHMVSGHVDGVGKIVGHQDLGGSVQLDVQAPKELLRYVWKKGSWAVNGVSLTINSVDTSTGIVGHCLIPETLQRTNLGNLKVGGRVNLEVDMMARAIVTTLDERPKEMEKS